MLTSRALLVPHLPTLLVDEHRGHRTPMLEALAEQSARLLTDHPDAVVILSARWMSDGPFRVGVGRRHRTLTDYAGFGVEVRYDCDGHPAIGRALVERGLAAGVRVSGAERGVDSGVTVPLHFLLPRRSTPIVPLSLAAADADTCRTWGASIRQALAARSERVGFIVGGMLSHDQHSWQFKRDVPEAREFDEHALRAIAEGDWGGLRDAGAGFGKAHPEAGLLHLEVLRGFLGSDQAGQVRCYESGPGMGAALVEFELDKAPASTHTGN